MDGCSDLSSKWFYVVKKKAKHTICKSAKFGFTKVVVHICFQSFVNQSFFKAQRGFEQHDDDSRRKKKGEMISARMDTKLSQWITILAYLKITSAKHRSSISIQKEGLLSIFA